MPLAFLWFGAKRGKAVRSVHSVDSPQVANIALVDQDQRFQSLGGCTPVKPPTSFSHLPSGSDLATISSRKQDICYTQDCRLLQKMPVDARGLSAHVLVDGRAVPELSDPDTTPRDWAFLRTAATNGQVSPEAAAACAQSKCLVATTAGTRFEVVVVNATRHHLCVDTFVDGRKIDSLSLFGEHAARDEQTGAYGPDERYMWTARIEGDYVGATTASDRHERRAAHALRAAATSGRGRPRDARLRRRVPGRAHRCGRAGHREPRRQEAHGRGPRQRARRGRPGHGRNEEGHFWPGHFLRRCHRDGGEGFRVWSHAHAAGVSGVFAAFSFRYAAIEALHIAKTTPKAWLDRETALIEAARQSSRDLRRHLRAGFAISEPPTYLFSSKLSPLAGPGAPKAVADRVKLDKALRARDLSLVGEPRSLFDALSHQLCGTHQLSRYVEHDSVCSTFFVLHAVDATPIRAGTPWPRS